MTNIYLPLIFLFNTEKPAPYSMFSISSTLFPLHLGAQNQSPLPSLFPTIPLHPQLLS